MSMTYAINEAIRFDMEIEQAKILSRIENRRRNKSRTRKEVRKMGKCGSKKGCGCKGGGKKK